MLFRYDAAAMIANFVIPAVATVCIFAGTFFIWTGIETVAERLRK